MVLDPIPQSLPVHFFGSRPQPPTSRRALTVENLSKSHLMTQGDNVQRACSAGREGGEGVGGGTCAVQREWSWVAVQVHSSDCPVLVVSFDADATKSAR